MCHIRSEAAEWLSRPLSAEFYTALCHPPFFGFRFLVSSSGGQGVRMMDAEFYTALCHPSAEFYTALCHPSSLSYHGLVKWMYVLVSNPLSAHSVDTQGSWRLRGTWLKSLFTGGDDSVIRGWSLDDSISEATDVRPDTLHPTPYTLHIHIHIYRYIDIYRYIYIYIYRYLDI